MSDTKIFFDYIDYTYLFFLNFYFVQINFQKFLILENNFQSNVYFKVIIFDGLVEDDFFLILKTILHRNNLNEFLLNFMINCNVCEKQKSTLFKLTGNLNFYFDSEFFTFFYFYNILS